MQQLSGGDTIFLAMETAVIHGHTGGLTILDPTGVEDWSFERFRGFLEERLAQVPRFRWKLSEVPMGLDRPYWVEDTEFDLDNHVRRIGVPAPGGMQQVADTVSYLFERKLDRSRPMWEMWYVDGLEGGRVAMFAKIHHCLMDGMSGAGLGEILCDLSPDAPPLTAEVAPAESPQVPGPAQIAWRMARDAAKRPARLARFGAQVLSYGAALVSGLRDPASPPLPTQIPKVGFNGEIGPHRGFACTSIELERVKALKKHFDVTVNDVLLAVTGGALRRYLDGRGELPEQSLTALVPISLRAADDTELGNQIGNMTVSWATDVADPAERLRRIHAAAERSKQIEDDHPVNSLSFLGGALPPGLVHWIFRALGLSPAMSPMPGNAVLSNVRGTPVPLYCAGARIESLYPMSLLLPGQGLNITAVSYTGRVDVGFTVDPELVPDVWELADEIGRALEELEGCMDVDLERERRLARAREQEALSMFERPTDFSVAAS